MFEHPRSWCLKLGSWLVLLFFGAMIVVTLLQVVFRYAVGAPLPWSEEAARYCFVWVVFLGAALGFERGTHIGVDIITNLLPAHFRRWIGILSEVLILVFCLCVIYASLPVLEANWLQVSPAMEIKMSYAYAAIPVSMSIMSAITIGKIIRRSRGLVSM